MTVPGSRLVDKSQTSSHELWRSTNKSSHESGKVTPVIIQVKSQVMNQQLCQTMHVLTSHLSLVHTVCLKKRCWISAITLPNPSGFSKFIHYWKENEMSSYKNVHKKLPLDLDNFATLSCKIHHLFVITALSISHSMRYQMTFFSSSTFWTYNW